MSTHIDQTMNATKVAGDVAAGSLVLASLVAILPPIAAALGIIWYVLQIYAWVERRYKAKRRLTKKRRPG